MKVLLLSPLPGRDPAGGDITYTQTLLSDPPPGVEYVTYADALADGSLLEHGTRGALKRARLRSVGELGFELGLTSIAHTINRIRRFRWLFWEPFRFFSVKPGAFDVIHNHIYNARFYGLKTPLVFSNACPLR